MKRTCMLVAWAAWMLAINVESISGQAPLRDGVVVFIHGLYGGAASFQRQGSQSWPMLIQRDRDLAGYDVSVPTYPTGCGRNPSIHETATALRAQLRSTGVLKHRRIVIVAHSMGGLVAKDMILGMTDIEREKVGAVFLIGTPSQGATVAGLVNVLCKNGSAADLKTIGDNGYLQRLEDDWQGGARNARVGHDFPEVHCAYETQTTAGVMIVPRAQAATYCYDDPMPITENHINMVKPKDANAPVYQWVKAILKSSRLSGIPCIREEFPGGVGSSGWVLLGRYDLNRSSYVNPPRFEHTSPHGANDLPGTDELIRISTALRVIIRDYSGTAPRNLETAVAVPPRRWSTVNYADDFTGMWLCKGTIVEVRQRDIPNESDPIANVWARVAYPRR
jgi:pimeloyl-ACP methyl ester carboxylesterase